MRSPSGSRKNERPPFRLDEAILPPSAPAPPEPIDTISMGLSTLTPSKVPVLQKPGEPLGNLAAVRVSGMLLFSSSIKKLTREIWYQYRYLYYEITG